MVGTAANQSSCRATAVPRHRKTRDEFLSEMREQMSAMRASAKGYDDGQLWEAKRLATTAYILVHDSIRGRSRSLLTHLGLRGSLVFVSSISNPTRVVSGWDSRHGLMRVRMSGGKAYFVPKLQADSEAYRDLSFNDWYEEAVFHPLNGKTISRKNLIHYLRSQDGGAHVDAIIDNWEYHEWKMRGDPNLSYEFKDGHTSVFGPIIELATGKAVYDHNQGSPVLGSVHATMRQIAWELNESISKIGF